MSNGYFAECFKPPFRGEIWEFFKDVPMGRGFSNQNRPFDADTACYVKPVMREIRARPFGKFVIMAAVQMLKTNCTIEQPAGFLIANDPGDMTIYLTGDESAYDQAKARLAPYLKSQKDIAQIIQEVTSASSTGRHNIVTEQWFLPGMVLRIWPLNLTQTQRNTLRYVFISDAFLSERTGLIEQACKRTTQHDSIKVRDYKIIIESQGGEAGDDFDAQWLETDQRRLNVTCPYCASVQQFDWHKKRGEEFVPTPPMDIPSLDHAAWIAENRPRMISPDGCHAGMKRGDAAVKRPDGSFDADEVRRQTYYECYHCGSHWDDAPRTRQVLDLSSQYIATCDTAPPENIGFWWPAWAGQRLSWGNIMLDWLNAQAAMKQGNIEPLRQWHQKSEARPWSQDIVRPEAAISVGSYDPNVVMPDEFCRNMAVDVQQEQDIMEKTGKSVPGWFWYEAEAVDKFGNSQQLARGHCRTWEEWIAVQKQWKIPNDRVCLDIGHWPDLVMQRAANEREVVPVNNPVTPWLKFHTKTWYMLAGSPERSFGKHADGKIKPWSPEQILSVPVINADGRREMVSLKKVRWSNVAFKLQLDAILSKAPGMPRREILSREKLDAHTLEMETGMNAYEKQMEGEFYDPKRGKDDYSPVAANRPVHYRDTACMLLWRRAKDGLIGHQMFETEKSK